MNFSIDSRTIKPKEIFIAIKGANHDGHDYVQAALEKGAMKAIVQKDFPIEDERLIKVDDTLEYLQHLAKEHIKQHKYLIKIAITGSSGKTTAKEMLKAALTQIFGEEKVFASFGNFNNHIGLPLSALEINQDHRYAIFEMGMNHEGEIAKLCDIVNPDIGLITNIGHAHEGNFSDGIYGIAKAKGELFSALSPKGIAIINLDDQRIVDLAKNLSFKKTVTYGEKPSADLAINNENSISIKNQNITNINIPLLGRHNVFNALSALTICHALHLDIKKAAMGFSKMNLAKGRMELIDGPKETIIINDGYNANPASMMAGIVACKKVKAKRYIGVIGSMAELGKGSQKHHIELGKELAHNFDLLFLCGEHAQDMSLGAKEKNCLVYEKSEQIIEPLKKILHAGDVIFVKGSLSQNMQVIIDALIS